jgi:HAD superfamily hydrolase (TIGR01509 family)
VIIFDCNGVLVDSEQIAAAVAAQEFARAGVPITAELVSRYFLGRRPADMFAAIETVTKRKLPDNFGATVAAATIKRIRTELRAMPHVAHALTWLREPKCVASSSTLDRIRASLETTGLARFFEPHLFSASEVPNGKPAPDLLLHVAARMGVARSECIVVEDSPAGVAAATAAGMTAIGFIGGGHAGAKLGEDLLTAGARTIIADMRQLKGTIVAIRGW